MKNILFGLVILVGIGVSGCKTADKPALNSQDSSYGQTPSSRNSGATSGTSTRTSRKVANKKMTARTEADARAEFDERMKANAKKYAEQAKLAEKPQYSDPSYFGHKKKPKKRPPGKRKLCKECGIVH